VVGPAVGCWSFDWSLGRLNLNSLSIEIGWSCGWFCGRSNFNSLSIEIGWSCGWSCGWSFDPWFGQI